MIDIQINADKDTNHPVGFGIEVTNSNGDTIQTAIILQPIEKPSPSR